jgi:hypothetical protein
MATEAIVVTTAIAAGGYVGTKLFGTALATMGDDINKLYARGRDKIVDMASKKVSDPDDGKTVNLRAARDVLWNGAITDDEVCAEYFGGMLAAARSEDGKDDGVVHYVDTVKAMSARQLELHYVLYRALQAMLRAETATLNVAQSNDLGRRRIVVGGVELISRGLQFDRDLTVLHRQGLIGQFKYETKLYGSSGLPYVEVAPTTFGVMLYAIAHNKLDRWRSFPTESYESSAGILPLNFFAGSVDELSAAAGLKPEP